jgi:hypothetical protein
MNDLRASRSIHWRSATAAGCRERASIMLRASRSLRFSARSWSSHAEGAGGAMGQL